MGKFFQASGTLDAFVMTDFVLHEYTNANYIFNLKFDDGLKVIAEGYKRRTDDKLWAQYCTAYPYMTEENFITFEQFKKEAYASTEHKPQKTKTEIMTDVEKIIGYTAKKEVKRDGYGDL